MRSQRLKLILVTLGGGVGLLVLAAVAVRVLVDVNRYKPRLEMAASEALGMDVRAGGRLSMGLFPGFHVTVEDGRILSQQGVVVVSAKRAGLYIELIPLLRKKFRMSRVDLTQLKVSIERDPQGRSNFAGFKTAALLRALDGASVSLSDGTLLCADSGTGGGFEATHVDVAVSGPRFPGGKSMRVLNGLSLKAELACGEIRTKDFSVAALKGLVDGKDGVFELEPVTLRVFGGQASGSLRADVSDTIPRYQARCSLPRFRIEEFLKTLSPKKVVEGTMDFSASLSMRGKTGIQVAQTAAGEISLRGADLRLAGHDLDSEISRFKHSQSFNLVDVGAIFFAGPLGLAVTKGYNFASLFEGSGGSTRISTLISHWRVEHGVAQAKDVAMATPKNRIALQGGLDFVNGRFADVTVAVIDAGGCAKVRQAMRGSFARPEVERPDFLTSLAGPVLKLYRKTRRLFPAEPCEVFYSGSVAPPR